MTSEPDSIDRFAHQAGQYRFPYHWLPEADGSHWRLSRVLGWGYEYLGLIERVRDTVTSFAPGRVLDVGCGDGRLAHELLRAGTPQVTGVDLVEPAIGFAGIFNASFADRLTLRCGPVQDLPAGDRYDVVVAMEVLEHIPDDAVPGFVAALRERITPEGRLVVTVPTTRRPVQAKHYRHYDLPSLTRALEGFQVERAEWVHRDCRESRWLGRALVNRFVVLAYEPALRAITRRYRRRLLHASPGDGAHLLAVLAPASP